MRFTDDGQLLIDVPYCVVDSGDRFAVPIPQHVNRDNKEEVIAYLDGLAKDGQLEGVAESFGDYPEGIEGPIDDGLCFFEWRFTDDDADLELDDDDQ